MKKETISFRTPELDMPGARKLTTALREAGFVELAESLNARCGVVFPAHWSNEWVIPGTQREKYYESVEYTKTAGWDGKYYVRVTTWNTFMDMAWAGADRFQSHALDTRGAAKKLAESWVFKPDTTWRVLLKHQKEDEVTV